MKQDKWIKDMQRRMADHREPVDDDLWMRIEQTIDCRPVLQKRALYIARRRYIAAAAVVLLLIGTGSYLLFHRSRHQPAGLPVGNYLTEKSVKQVAPVKPTFPKDSAEKILAHARQTLKKSVIDLKKTVDDIATATEQPTQNLLVKVDSTNQPTPAKRQQPSAERYRESDRQMFMPRSYRHDSSLRLSMNLYAANTFGHYNGSNRLLMTDMMVSGYDAAQSKAFMYNNRAPIYLTSVHEETEHYQPISFGATASYALTDRWALTSGIVYTKLVSDFIQVMGDHRVTRRQTLHYLGVPLNVNYRIWSNKHMSTYVAAGGEVDFNVAVKTVKEQIDYDTEKDRPQYAAQLAVGLQYNLTPLVGAYVEPGVKYYIDNGSDTQNFFKNKPMNFNLQLGVRFQIK